jgi:hypothetical protein
LFGPVNEAAAVCVSPLINYWMPEPGMYRNVCVSLARQRLGKQVTAANNACNDTGIVGRLHFLCGTCRIKGKWAINSSQNSLFHITFIWSCK